MEEGKMLVHCIGINDYYIKVFIRDHCFLLFSSPLIPAYSLQLGTQHNHIILMEYRNVL